MAVESSEIQRGEYLPRVADGLLTQALQSSGAVQIKGPKWCGKTAYGDPGKTGTERLLRDDAGEVQ